jgi:hypothetical protein
MEWSHDVLIKGWTKGRAARWIIPVINANTWIVFFRTPVCKQRKPDITGLPLSETNISEVLIHK